MSMIKISSKELKEAIAWMEANTNEDFLKITINDSKLYVDGMDKGGQQVEITLFSKDASMMPKIMRTDIFPVKR